VLSCRWSRVVPCNLELNYDTNLYNNLSFELSCSNSHLLNLCIEQKECFDLHVDKSYNGAEAVSYS
jgi:hypothetical protein